MNLKFNIIVLLWCNGNTLPLRGRTRGSTPCSGIYKKLFNKKIKILVFPGLI